MPATNANLFLPEEASFGDRRSFSSYCSAMSTDTDDEGARRPSLVLAGDDPLPAAASPTFAPAAETVSMALITANVGSIFEEPEQLIPQWHDAVTAYLEVTRTQFVAMHFQEVGGKNIHDGMLEMVREFVQQLVQQAAKFGYQRHCAFFDQNYHSPDKFTALGSLYLIHNSLQRVALYNFERCEFDTVSESQLHVGCLDDDERPACVEKQKFPLQYFPDNRWSRKGYLHTRWRLSGTEIDLVNIHLFHDASNLVSVEAVPSIYCNYRSRALQYTLERLQASSKAFFIFGDFNFRLQGQGVLQKLTTGLSRVSPPPASTEQPVQFHDEEKRLVFSIGKKEFTLQNEHDETFQRTWNQWTEYDLETGSVADQLCEVPLNFPPTYPFEEDPAAGDRYMRTRCPAWCDRVLFSHYAKSVMAEFESPEDNKPAVLLSYDVIGRDVCMGDHKPVFLQFNLKSNALATAPTTAASNNDTRNSVVAKCPRVESPNYRDLLNDNETPTAAAAATTVATESAAGCRSPTEHRRSSPKITAGTGSSKESCTRYLDLKEVNTVKLFKETTV